MPRKPHSDPLVALSIRVPRTLQIALQRKAKAESCTLSDILRMRLSMEEAPVLGMQPPNRRKRIAHHVVSAADPALLRQIASIGSNLNQIARAVNTEAVNATQIDVIQVLLRLHSIEKTLTRIIAIEKAKIDDD